MCEVFHNSNTISVDNMHYRFNIKVNCNDNPNFEYAIENINSFIKILKDRNIIRGEIKLHFKSGYNQCVARLYDHNNINRLPNINKRCNNKAICGYDLCSLHNNIEKKQDWHLRVTEYPDQNRTIHEYLTRPYFNDSREKVQELEKSINLKHNILKISKNIGVVTLDGYNVYLNKIFKNKNLKVKNNIKYNSSMPENQIQEEFFENLEFCRNITRPEFENKLEKFCIENNLSYKEDSDMNDDEILKHSKNILKLIDIDTPNIGEVSAVYQCIKTKAKNLQNSSFLNKKDLKQIIRETNIYNCDKIRLINDFKAIYLYIIEHEQKKYLFNCNKKLIGSLCDWVDEDDEVPDVFKKNNIVLHPDTNIPIIEIEITKKGTAFENIKEGIYREYEYDEELETFRNTQSIFLDN